MREKLKRLAGRGWAAVSRAMALLVKTAATYFDDLLLIAGGACLTAASAQAFGRAAAFAVCGVCLIAYAVIIARAWGNKL